MDRQQIGLKLALDHLRLPIRLSSFDDRLILQKAVYLAQAATVDLGYGFHWYLRGPYSPALTRDAFAMLGELDRDLDESQGWQLDEASVGRLTKLVALISEPAPERLASHLELLASVHFLLVNRPLHGHSAPELREVLQRYDKHYTEEEIHDAVEKLRQHGLTAGRQTE